MKRSRVVLVLGMVAVIALFFVFDPERFFTLEALKAQQSCSRSAVPAPLYPLWRRDAHHRLHHRRVHRYIVSSVPAECGPLLAAGPYLLGGNYMSGTDPG